MSDTVIGFTDEQSHYIQSEIEFILYMLKDSYDTKDIVLSLVEVRDMIPCTCGEEYE